MRPVSLASRCGCRPGRLWIEWQTGRHFHSSSHSPAEITISRDSGLCARGAIMPEAPPMHYSDQKPGFDLPLIVRRLPAHPDKQEFSPTSSTKTPETRAHISAVFDTPHRRSAQPRTKRC